MNSYHIRRLSCMGIYGIFPVIVYMGKEILYEKR